MFGESDWTFYYRSHEQMDKNLFPLQSKILILSEWTCLLTSGCQMLVFISLIGENYNKEKHTVLFYTYLKNG